MGKPADAVFPDALQDVDAVPEPAPIPLEIEWDVVVTAYDGGEGVLGAMMLPTGIAVITDQDIFLVDKADGHMIARAPWPVVRDYWAALLVGGLVTKDGTLALVLGLHVEEMNDERLFVHEYSGTDLSLLRNVQVSFVRSLGGAIVEHESSLYTLIKRHEETNYLDLVQISSQGIVETSELGDGGEDYFHNNGFSTADGKLLFCFNHWNEAPAELVTIDPETGTLQRRTFIDEIQASARCRLLASPERLLLYWHGGDQGNWVVLSRDGQTILASHHQPFPDVDTHAYVAGDFVSLVPSDITGQRSRLYLYAVDAETLAVRGPYSIQLPPGMDNHGQHQLVSDGENLYAVLSVGRPPTTGEIRLLNLGPIPDE